MKKLNGTYEILKGYEFKLELNASNQTEYALQWLRICDMVDVHKSIYLSIKKLESGCIKLIIPKEKLSKAMEQLVPFGKVEVCDIEYRNIELLYDLDEEIDDNIFE